MFRPNSEDAGNDCSTHQRHQQRSGESGDGRVAAAPAPRPLAAANGASLDRLTLQEPPEVCGQFLGRTVALPRVLLQALEADRFQVARDGGIQLPRRHRVVMEHLEERIERVIRLERRPAGEQAIQHGTE